MRDPAGDLLDEVPEAQAEGTVRDIYAEIRRLSGTPMVALIYRHLAAIPGALEWAWALLEPSMQAGRIQSRAAELADAMTIRSASRIPSAALRIADLSADDERRIGFVLDAYNRANPINIMALSCLALHLDASFAGSAAASGDDGPQVAPRTPLPPLPPIVEPKHMNEPTLAVISLLTNREDGRERSPLMPSLYRHLAHWPSMLGYAAVVVLPQFDAIDRAADGFRSAVLRESHRMAQGMAVPGRIAAPSIDSCVLLTQAIERFTVRIPEMVAIGRLLQHAMPSERLSA